MALIVNGQRIDESIVQTEFAQIKAYFENLGNVSCCERDDEFRGYAKQNVVARALLAQAALNRLPKTPDPEVDAALAKLMEEYGGESRFYTATGASPEQMHLVRHDVELDLRVKQMLESLVDDVVPSEEALRDFYREHLSSYMTAEEVRASHILKSPKRGEARAGAYEELRKLREQIENDTDFDALARQHSDKADDHVDLGFFKRGELAEEFETVAFSMRTGEISPVFLSPFGYHLIKLTGRKPAVARPFEEVRAEVELHLRDSIRQERTKLLVEELRATAVVEEAADEPAEPVTA